jgi:hypothetical protein
MRKTRDAEGDGFGHDSFLDVVTNIVGIMIILVMVSGMRVKEHSTQAALLAAPESFRELRKQLEAARAEAWSIHTHALDLQNKLQTTGRVIEAARGEKTQLAAQLVLVDREIEMRSGQLDETERKELELRAQILELEGNIQELESRRRGIEASARQVLEVKSLPTPLASAVSGKEAHYRLAHGRIVHIPLDQLIEEFKDDAQQRLGQIGMNEALSETIGPIDGISLRYTLVKESLAPAAGMAGTVVRLKSWRILPAVDEMGETAAEALGPNSRFRRSLDGYHPGTITITIWTYPDSFREFRALKEELYRLGYETAARPLPAGFPIMGSPEGSRSTAQ